MQEQIVAILNCFNEQTKFYPVRWSGEGNDSISVQGVFWLSNFSENVTLIPKEIFDVLYNLTEIQTEMISWEEMESFYQLALYSKRVVGEKSEDTLLKNEEYRRLISEQRRLLCTYLHQNNVEQGIELTDTLLHSYLSNGVSFAQKYCIDTIIQLLNEMWREDNTEIRERIFEQCIDKTVLTPMSRDTLINWMNECIRNIFAERNKKQFKQKASLDKVINYIRMHYAENITLSQIGESVYMNPSYISRMVKEQTGKNVTDLVTEMRMERTLVLLQTTDLRIYKIAEMVGYTNLQYFYKVFRKNIGKSPSDFRDNSNT